MTARAPRAAPTPIPALAPVLRPEDEEDVVVSPVPDPDPAPTPGVWLAEPVGAEFEPVGVEAGDAPVWTKC